jgi:hypothetical protein
MPLGENQSVIVKLYKSGLTQKEVGKIVGLSERTVGVYLRKSDIKSHRKFSGESNSNWKGGVMYDRGRKLIYSPKHPRPDFLKKIYCYEYRLIMEKHLGRYLNDDEIVHHINGDHTDNSIENLQVMTQTEHIALHKKQGNMKRGYKSKFTFKYNNREEYRKLYNKKYQEENKERLIEYRRNKRRMKKDDTWRK